MQLERLARLSAAGLIVVELSTLRVYYSTLFRSEGYTPQPHKLHAVKHNVQDSFEPAVLLASPLKLSGRRDSLLFKLATKAARLPVLVRLTC